MLNTCRAEGMKAREEVCWSCLFCFNVEALEHVVLIGGCCASEI